MSGKRGRLVAAGMVLYAIGTAGAVADEKTIDLCHYTPTFTEDFSTLSVASNSNRIARWSAHTPWGGDFGDAIFIDPITEFAKPEMNHPFFVKDGILTIRAQKRPDGRWTSGLLSSTDAETLGFAQTYGYFEARMKMPPGPGVWPAFWLAANAGRDDRTPGVEIDVVEYYGRFPAAFNSVLHVWNKVDRDLSRGEEITTKVEEGSLSGAFHTYGVDVGPESIVYYLDRREIGRQKTPPEHDKPLTVLVNLALGSGWPIDKTPDPSDLLVDYIHVYQRNENAGQGSCG